MKNNNNKQGFSFIKICFHWFYTKWEIDIKTKVFFLDDLKINSSMKLIGRFFFKSTAKTKRPSRLYRCRPRNSNSSYTNWQQKKIKWLKIYFSDMPNVFIWFIRYGIIIWHKISIQNLFVELLKLHMNDVYFSWRNDPQKNKY